MTTDEQLPAYIQRQYYKNFILYHVHVVEDRIHPIGWNKNQNKNYSSRNKHMQNVEYGLIMYITSRGHFNCMDNI